MARYELIQQLADRFARRVFGGKPLGEAVPAPAVEAAVGAVKKVRDAVATVAPEAVAAVESTVHALSAEAAERDRLERNAAFKKSLATRPPCPSLWKTPVIRWDGRVHVCCADLDGQIPLGNTRETPFSQLWNGETMKQYRILHIEGRFDEMPVCGPCTGFNWYEQTPAEIEDWLRSVGREDVIPTYRARMGQS